MSCGETYTLQFMNRDAASGISSAYVVKPVLKAMRVLKCLGDAGRELPLNSEEKEDLPTLAGNSVVMLSKAKHPNGETLTINATGIPHCVRNDKFPVKAGRAKKMKTTFSEIVTTEEQLREVLGYPHPSTIAKIVPTLDTHCRTFIAKSPFMLIASADTQGNVDVSPKGDPPGFVQALDDVTLVIPDRLGNRLADTFRNILQTGKVGLIFLVPGKQETLRVSGNAIIVRDGWLREQMAIDGKIPNFAIVVTIEKIFFHCAKCVIRSKIWNSDQWADLEGLPSLAQILVDHGKLSDSVEEMQVMIDQSYRDRLY